MSHYFPMVSSSPPPFDDNHSFEDDNEDADEFGDFSSAGNILQDDPNFHNCAFNNFGFSPQTHQKQVVADVEDIENVVKNIKLQESNASDIQPVLITNGIGEHSERISTENCNSANLSDNEEVDLEIQKQSYRSLSEYEGEESKNTEPVSIANQAHVNIEESVQNIIYEESDNFWWGEGVENTNTCTQNFICDGVIDSPAVEYRSEVETPAGNEEQSGYIEIDNCDIVSGDQCVDEKDELTSSLSENRECVLEDDFADFENAIDNSDADFDDFQTFESAPKLESCTVATFETNFDAFKDDFSRPFHSNSSDVTFEENNDEFGNFESTSQISSFDQLITSTLASVFQIFENNSNCISSAIIDLEEALKQKPSASSECVWEKLNDIDNTHALTYHWGNSRSNKLLLHSLHLNSQNFLPGAKWASSIPLFAANLCADPLEPTKAPFGNGEDGQNVSNSIQKTLATSNPTEMTVPPAQFDWGSSGLINPLDDSTSALLDLDFFLTNDYVVSNCFSSASKKINSLETEFLGNEATAKSLYSGMKPLSPLLDKILSAASRTVSSTGVNGSKCQRTNISEEAKQILSSLQDLSFMQAKVLMFPIRDEVGYNS